MTQRPALSYCRPYGLQRHRMIEWQSDVYTLLVEAQALPHFESGSSTRPGGQLCHQADRLPRRTRTAPGAGRHRLRNLNKKRSCI